MDVKPAEAEGNDGQLHRVATMPPQRKRPRRWSSLVLDVDAQPVEPEGDAAHQPEDATMPDQRPTLRRSVCSIELDTDVQHVQSTFWHRLSNGALGESGGVTSAVRPSAWSSTARRRRTFVRNSLSGKPILHGDKGPKRRRSRVRRSIPQHDLALSVKKKWLDLILSGRKTWEIRGTRTNNRRMVRLAQSGSGMLMGEVRITNCTRREQGLDGDEADPVRRDGEGAVLAPGISAVDLPDEDDVPLTEVFGHSVGPQYSSLELQEESASNVMRSKPFAFSAQASAAAALTQMCQ
jgi:hypothetical protein